MYKETKWKEIRSKEGVGGGTVRTHKHATTSYIGGKPKKGGNKLHQHQGQTKKMQTPGGGGIQIKGTKTAEKC